MDKGFTSAHLQPGGVPPKHLKFGFKFSVDTPKTLRLVGVTSWNCIMQHAARQAWEFGNNLNVEGQKTSIIRRDFWKLTTLIANISGTDRYDENRKITWSTATPTTSGEIFWWTLVHQQKSYGAHVYTETQLCVRFRTTSDFVAEMLQVLRAQVQVRVQVQVLETNCWVQSKCPAKAYCS